MVGIIDVKGNTSRTFGWVQNPSSFESLRKVVEIFDENSKTHKELVDFRIQKLVEEKDGRDRLLDALNKRPLEIKYSDLVGKPFRQRKEARCNGIVQAVVKGQSKEFTDDWTSDGFVRWAHALGFIKYNYNSDSFFISELGIKYTSTEVDSEEEMNVLEEALLSYPPVSRVLGLLSNGEHLTKYEIGRQLGFTGESGFTSLPLNVLIMTLANTDEAKEKNKIRTDWDGSSDKYARMIASWLEKLDLVVKRPKVVTIDFGGESYSETIGHAYMITNKGLKAYRRLLGINKVSRVAKNVFWEMLSTKGIDKNYLRTRRAYILKFLIEASKILKIDDIKDKLSNVGINESNQTIKDDIDGLINIGINIKHETTGYKLFDTINDFVIPRFNGEVNQKCEINIEKDKLRENLKNISHDYLSLIDLAFDSKQNRLFEMKTIELLVNEFGFKGKHLGGGRKPDGIVYSTDLDENYGIIIDTKAYSGGYNLPISQADEMERYVRENNSRDDEINPNKWWTNFHKELKKYYFIFVSGSFKGKYEEQIKRISMTTGIKGGAIDIITLLVYADKIKSGKITLKDLEQEIFIREEL